MAGFVYIWENTINGKKYLGSHKGEPDDNYIGSGMYFKRAFKSNPKAFVRRIIYQGDDFIEIEDLALKTLDAANNKNYYNLKNDAIGGWEHCKSDEVKVKIAKAISESKKGKTYPFMFYNKEGENNPMYGKQHSQETKNKMSNSRKGKATFTKNVIEKTTGIIYKSVVECANAFGVTDSTMSVLIRNKEILKGKCKGKIFDYV